jgi:adenosylcobinamide-GDP ribazoletransferase
VVRIANRRPTGRPKIVTHDEAIIGAGPRPRTGELTAAIAFLTRVPVGFAGDRPATTGAAGFGFVGAVLGLAAALPLLIGGPSHPVLAAVACVAVIAVLDGGLHLDGLADTFDALAAPEGAAERARTDPRAGTAGVVAIVIVLGLDVTAIAEIAARSTTAAVVAVVMAACLSRALAPAVAVFGRATGPRAAGRLGSWFAAETTAVQAIVSLVTALVATLVATQWIGPRAAIAATGGTLLSAVLASVTLRARGQIDGDGYGAVIELSFAAVLVTAALVG